jgi:chromosome segregation ATPase
LYYKVEDLEERSKLLNEENMKLNLQIQKYQIREINKNNILDNSNELKHNEQTKYINALSQKDQEIIKLKMIIEYLETKLKKETLENGKIVNAKNDENKNEEYKTNINKLTNKLTKANSKISELNLTIDDLQSEKLDLQIKFEDLTTLAKDLRRQSNNNLSKCETRKASVFDSDESLYEDLSFQVKSLKAERENLTIDNTRLANDIKMLILEMNKYKHCNNSEDCSDLSLISYID